MFSSAFLSALLLSPSVLAVPGPGTPIFHHTHWQPKSKVVGSSVLNPNWAGAVWKAKPNTFTTINGTFTVPTISGDEGSGVAAWLGIDGYSCETAILQTGVTFTISDGEPTYFAWCQWFPDAPQPFFNVTVSAGDVIQLAVNSLSTTSGIASVQNLSNGDSGSQNLSSGSALCGQDAEWIVEDFQSSGSQVPFANFSTVTFTDARAGSYTPDGATILDIQQNKQVLTSVVANRSSVTIQYV